MSENTKSHSIWKIFMEALRGEERDYTSGSIRLAIVLLAIPMILELSMESLFAVVDMYFVGKLGEHAIAVVGYTEAMLTIIYSMAIGLSTAATAVISRRVGEKSEAEASETAVQSLILAALISVILSVIAVLSARHLLAFMGASSEVIEKGLAFTQIMFGSSGIIIFIFLINGIFRGAGNASIAMRSLWLASIANIILDPLLIYGIGHWTGWGLEGAAIATCIGRSMGVIYQCTILFSGKSVIRLSVKNFLPDKKLMIHLLELAWPATFQFIIASGSWIILTKLVAETGGTSASAAYQIAIRNVVFFILPAWGLSNAAATLVGQNLGAKNPERAAQSTWMCVKYNIFFMAIVTLIFLLFADVICGLFTTDPEVLSKAALSLRFIGSGFIFYGIGMVMMQALNGAGDTKTPTYINLVGFWLFQIPLAVFLTQVLKWNYLAAVAAVPIAETLVAILAWWYFKKGRWKTIEV
jgi:putative MATE family efflux protein